GLSDPPPPWLGSWKGDGILMRVEKPEMFEVIRRAGVPVVNLRGTVCRAGIPYVTIDNLEIAKLALQHLRERGLRNFAFCGRPDTTNPALVQRGEHFRQMIESDGGVCHVFSPPKRA